MAIIVDIEKAEEQALRALDGMSYNKDQMARNVVGMVAELRNWRLAFARMKNQTTSDSPDMTKFSTAFNEIFGDVFGKR